MITERTVVGMLGYGHQLHGVIARLSDAGQHLIAKLNVRADLLLLLRHADVRLIYQEILLRSALPSSIFPLVRLGGIPELCGVVLRHLVLYYTCSVGRYAIVPAVLSVNMEFIQRAMCQQMPIHSLGQEYLPHATLPTIQTQLGALPRIEVTKDKDILRLGQPLAEPPPLERIVPLPAVVAVAIGIINDCGGLLLDSLHTLQVALMTIPYLISHGLQPLIRSHNRQ